MKYVVACGGTRWEVEVEGERVTVNGIAHAARLVRFEGSPTGRLELAGHRIPLVLEALGQGRWIIGTRGDRVEVDVQDERLERARRAAASSRPHRISDVLLAPMPGLVVRVAVQAGQPVEAGSSLVVLEAMKMENELRAVGSAIVDRIEVQPGQPVEKGDVLVRFLPPTPPA
jgi:biotin carboxyl carrier protein